jgi:tetratricopeptide (TPR) repeat protein/tRNA A-37 threonylcarbamoyl transferase component Bud32
MPDLERLTAALADRYRIERELGQGGMATVYLAEDLKHRRQVALKVLRPELSVVLGAERFLQEIRVTANLQHPHILPLYDSGDAGGLLFYVMPWVEGETLRAKLEREKQLSIDETLEIAKAVAGALEFAHQRGVIHRDIKPENVLFQAGQAVVADFGIALAVSHAGGSRLTETGLSIGTPLYMSPEQATGERDIDARSDVYALGCVVYEMLAGETPFTGPNARAILSKQLTDSARPVGRLRDGVPPQLDAALARALARAPADRFPGAAAFATALDTAARSTGPAGHRPRAAWRAAAGAVAVVVVVAAAALLLRPGARAAVPSLRVERFGVAGADTASAYLAATLEQDVVGSLAATRAVRVFRTASADISSDYVVSGQARRGSDSALLELTLTRGGTGEVASIAKLSRPLGRVQELPDAAAEALLASLSLRRVTPRAAPPQRDSVAYDLYLRGRYQADRRTEAALGRSVGLFRDAIARAPGFAEAWAGLVRALVYSRNWRYRIPGVPPDSIVPLMVAASERALELDSSRAYVWIARALVLRVIEPASRRDLLAALGRAIAADSNSADAWFFAGTYWEDSLEPARALAALHRAANIDPTHVQALGFLSLHFMWARQYDSAATWADSAQRIDATHILPREAAGLAHLLRGELRDAEDEFEAVVRLGQGPDGVEGWAGLADIAWRRGDRRGADTLVARARAAADTLHPSIHDAAYLAWAYVATGDKGRALRLLERLEPRRDVHFQLHLQRDPTLDALRSDPRFTALLSRPAVARGGAPSP